MLNLTVKGLHDMEAMLMGQGKAWRDGKVCGLDEHVCARSNEEGEGRYCGGITTSSA